jgi:hypothetical protein
MGCVAKNLLLWTLAVPWVASTVWLSLDSVIFGNFLPKNLFVSLGVCGVLVAPLGVLWCMPITIPSGVITCCMFVFRPKLMHRRCMRIWFVVATSSIGAMWAKCIFTWLSLEQNEGYLLIISGFLAGLFLGCGTLWIWGNAKIEASRVTHQRVGVTSSHSTKSI